MSERDWLFFGTLMLVVIVFAVRVKFTPIEQTPQWLRLTARLASVLVIAIIVGHYLTRIFHG